MKDYSAIKRHQLIYNVKLWVNLKIIMKSERGQTEHLPQRLRLCEILEDAVKSCRQSVLRPVRVVGGGVVGRSRVGHVPQDH